MSKRANKRRRVYKILRKERETQEWCWNCGNTFDSEMLAACHSTRSGERPTEDDGPNNGNWYYVAWCCLPCTMKLHKLNSHIEKREIQKLRKKHTEHTHPEVELKINEF